MFFNRDSLKALAMLTQMGITMIVAVALGFFAGDFLDKQFGTAPIFMLLFVFLGIAAGFRNIYWMTKSIVNSTAEEEKKKQRIIRQYEKRELKGKKEE